MASDDDVTSWQLPDWSIPAPNWASHPVLWKIASRTQKVRSEERTPTHTHTHTKFTIKKTPKSKRPPLSEATGAVDNPSGVTGPPTASFYSHSSHSSFLSHFPSSISGLCYKKKTNESSHLNFLFCFHPMSTPVQDQSGAAGWSHGDHTHESMTRRGGEEVTACLWLIGYSKWLISESVIGSKWVVTY